MNRRGRAAVDTGMQRRTTSRSLALAASAVLAFGLAACGDDDDSSSDTTEATSTTEATEEPTTSASVPDTTAGDLGGASDALATDATVVASGFRFEVPASVTAGATVTFDNQDDVPHTMTADDEAFDSGRVSGGSSGTVTAPTEPGSYAFHCEVHPNMTATLTVA